MNLNLEKAIEQTMKLQDTANKVMAGEDWTKKGIDWTSCSLAELGEAMGWTGYKHWKKTEPNFFQAFIEVIDSYHFMLSLAIERGTSPNTLAVSAATFSNIFADKAEYFRNCSDLNEQKKIAKFGLKELTKCCLDAEDSTPALWLTAQAHLKAAAHLGFDAQDFFKIYVSKNTVNLFRQANGDREGNYPRIWNFEGEQIEDNQVVEILVKRDPELGYDADRLTQTLQGLLDEMRQTSGFNPSH